MKKKLLSTVLMLAMAATLAACGSSSKESTTSDAGTTNEQTTTENGTTESGDSVSADVQKIIDRGVLKVGCKTDIPKFSLQNTATGEYEGFEDDLAYEIAGSIFGVSADDAKENITMICVTHEMGFAKQVADRVIFMDGGYILEEGTPQHFFENPEHERTKAFLSKILH